MAQPQWPQVRSPLKGELVLPLLGFVPIGQDLLHPLKQFPGYQGNVISLVLPSGSSRNTMDFSV